MTTASGSQRPTPDVVVVGESLTDIITTSAGPVEFAGGSGLNVAYGLGRLGPNTGLLTMLGADRRAEVIRQHLASAAVQVCRVPPAGADWDSPNHSPIFEEQYL